MLFFFYLCEFFYGGASRTSRFAWPSEVSSLFWRGFAFLYPSSRFDWVGKPSLPTFPDLMRVKPLGRPVLVAFFRVRQRFLR